jgi:UDP-3-O-[3-hydroxymyristoyl] N-acetylglucosamine deacetylase
MSVDEDGIPMQFQGTIKKEIVLEGVGLHSGHTARVTIQPAPVDTGIVFSSGLYTFSEPVHAHYSNLVDTNNAITIGNENYSIQTIEHFMAALFAMGVYNARVFVHGKEMPILDGSSKPIVAAIQNAGVLIQAAIQEIFRVPYPIWVEENGGYLIALPADDFRVTYTIDFSLKSSAVGTQTAHFIIDRKTFCESIAPARTFGFYDELEYLKRNNLALGGSLENALVFTRDGLINDDLRFGNECVRHKMLDLIGDLSLIGYPLAGHFIAYKAGHTMDLNLARKIDVVCQRKKRSKALSREIIRRREFAYRKFKQRVNFV